MTNLTERPLSFRDPIEGEVSLTPDQHAVMMREIHAQAAGFAMLHNLLEKGQPISKELVHNVVYVSESRNSQICAIMGLEMDSVSDRNKRFEDIREVNAQNRELRLQLGLTGTVEQTKAHLKALAAAVTDWWYDAGFGYVSDLRFTESGVIEAEFSVNLNGGFMGSRSATPMTDAENTALLHKDLQTRGFQLVVESSSRAPALPDCDQNKIALTKLFKSKFPSSQVSETKNFFNSRDNLMVLRSAHVYIRNLQEVMDLATDPSAPA